VAWNPTAEVAELWPGTLQQRVLSCGLEPYSRGTELWPGTLQQRY